MTHHQQRRRQRPKSAAAILCARREGVHNDAFPGPKATTDTAPGPLAPSCQITRPASAAATPTVQVRQPARPARRRPLTATATISTTVVGQEHNITQSTGIERNGAPRGCRRRRVVSAGAIPRSASTDGNNKGKDRHTTQNRRDGEWSSAYVPAGGCNGGGRGIPEERGDTFGARFWYEFNNIAPDPGGMRKVTEFVEKVIRMKAEGKDGVRPSHPETLSNRAPLNPSSHNYRAKHKDRKHLSAILAAHSSGLPQEELPAKISKALNSSHKPQLKGAGECSNQGSSVPVASHETNKFADEGEFPFPISEDPSKSANDEDGKRGKMVQDSKCNGSTGISYAEHGTSILSNGISATCVKPCEGKDLSSRQNRDPEQTAVNNPLSLDVLCSMRPTLRRTRRRVTAAESSGGTQRTPRRQQWSLSHHFGAAESRPPPPPPRRQESLFISNHSVPSWKSVFGAAVACSSRGSARADVLDAARRRIRQQRRCRECPSLVEYSDARKRPARVIGVTEVDLVMRCAQEVVHARAESQPVGPSVGVSREDDAVTNCVVGGVVGDTKSLKCSDREELDGSAEEAFCTANCQEDPWKNHAEEPEGEHRKTDDATVCLASQSKRDSAAIRPPVKPARTFSSDMSSTVTSAHNTPVSHVAPTRCSCIPSTMLRHLGGDGATRMGVNTPRSLQVSAGGNGIGFSVFLACNACRNRHGGSTDPRSGRYSGRLYGSSSGIQHLWTAEGANGEGRQDHRRGQLERLNSTTTEDPTGQADGRLSGRCSDSSSVWPHDQFTTARSRSIIRPWSAECKPYCGGRKSAHAVGEPTRNLACCVQATIGSSSCSTNGNQGMRKGAGSLW